MKVAAHKSTQTAMLPAPPVSGFLVRARIIRQLIFLLCLLGVPRAGQASDTYGALLDKKFSPGAKAITNAPPESTENSSAANVAALEQALKNRALKIEQGPPPPPPPDVNHELAVTITCVVSALLALKSAFIISKFQASRKAAAEAREEAKIKRIGEDPTIVSLFNELQHGLIPSSGESVPEAHTVVCGEETGESTLASDAIQLFEMAPLLFAQLHQRFSEISNNPDMGARLRMLHEFSEEIRPSKTAAQVPALRSHRLLALALEGMLKQLSIRPQNLTPWRMRLASQTLELLEDLCVPNLTPDLATKPAIRLLVVDDCAVSRHAMVFALKKVFQKPDLAEGGKAALGLAASNAYDVIFLDVEMPGMDGFELCTRIRETPLNRNTPIVFVTSHDNFESRIKLVSKGAQDLIGKPYLPTEITLKALQLALYGRLEHGVTEAPSEKPSENCPTPSLPSLSPAPLAT